MALASQPAKARPLSYAALDAWWWPYLFILLAGWLATDSWRFLGVYIGNRIREDSDFMVLVRAVATALVAGVISSLIVAPGGALADTPLSLRIAAAATGLAVYLVTRKNMLAGILAGEAMLLAGLLLPAVV